MWYHCAQSLYISHFLNKWDCSSHRNRSLVHNLYWKKVVELKTPRPPLWIIQETWADAPRPHWNLGSNILTLIQNEGHFSSQTAKSASPDMKMQREVFHSQKLGFVKLNSILKIILVLVQFKIGFQSNFPKFFDQV